MGQSTPKAAMPGAIWALGLASLFMDTSSEIIHSLLPVFLVSVLGASMTSVGVLEGIAEAVPLLLKIVSGTLSDWFGRRKPLVVLGYTIAALTKPFFAVATTIQMVYAARIADRIGKGIRGAPRDALVADLSPVELRGRAFGLRQSLDTVGAFLGPMVAVLLMHATNNDYRFVFWCATIPGILCVAFIAFGVREHRDGHTQIQKQALTVKALGKFSLAFWFVVGAGAIFQFARFSEAFLILRVRDFGLGLGLVPLVLIIMNIVYAGAAYPIGRMSDRFRREWFLLFGLIVLCFSELTLALGTSLYTVFGGIALWGLHLALTQGTLAVLVTDTCPPSYRGTGYGIFNLCSAVALLLGNFLAGILWDGVGPNATFMVGAVFSFVSFVIFICVKGLWSDGVKS